jgi:predicted RNA-binding protein with PUA domain
MVVMSYEDAKLILRDVLYYEYVDSLYNEYKNRDSLNTNTINIQKNVIDVYLQKITNIEQMNENLNSVIINKNSELSLNEDIIKQQKKEIRKQKILKVIGFIGSVALPIVTIILVL